MGGACPPERGPLEGEAGIRTSPAIAPSHQQLPFSPTVCPARGPGNEPPAAPAPTQLCARVQSTYCVPASVPAGGKHAKALSLGAPVRGRGRPWLHSQALQGQALAACGPVFRAGGRSALPRMGSRLIDNRRRWAPPSNSHRGARRAGGSLAWGQGGHETLRPPEGGGRAGDSPSRLLGVLVFAVRLQGRVDLLPQRLDLGRVREPLGVCRGRGRRSEAAAQKAAQGTPSGTQARSRTSPLGWGQQRPGRLCPQ